jgi:chromosome segregation ATPase
MEENKRLINELAEKDERIEVLELNAQKMSQKVESSIGQSDEVQKLYDTIESKNQIIDRLNSTLEEDSSKFNKIINDQTKKIKELSSQIENFQSEQAKNQEITKKLDEKELIIKDLKEQLQYLESDSIQKSKFEKLEVLLEKKDEIITEKEKTIFTLENEIKAAKQKIHDLQQQLETFNLVKKDLEKKTERNKALVVEIEELKQKKISNQEMIEHLEKKLEEAHKKAGNLTGKFELEMANMRSMIDYKDDQIKSLKGELKEIQTKIDNTEQIEKKFLDELEQLKNEKMKLDSDCEEKNNEIIDLKKKIKLMRRDMQK